MNNYGSTAAVVIAEASSFLKHRTMHTTAYRLSSFIGKGK